MSQQLQFTPSGTSFWAGLVEFAVVDTTNGVVVVQQANRDDSEAVPFTGAPSPTVPVSLLTNAGLVQLVGSPIAFINPVTVAEYKVQGTEAVIVTFLSGRTQAFTYAAMVNFLAWVPPVIAGVFEAGSGINSVQQAGVGANAAGLESFAFGVGAQALSDYAIAFGNGAWAGFQGIALGAASSAQPNYSIAIGGNASANGFAGNIAIGQGANASGGPYAIALGWNTIAPFDYSIAIGYQATATDAYSIAFGYQAQASNYAIAIGMSAQADIIVGTAIGINAYCGGDGGIAIGANTFVGGFAFDSIAFGTNSTANNANAIVFAGRTSDKSDCMFIQGLDIENGYDIHLATDTGTRLGTSTAQKLGFWGATPIARPSVSTSGTEQTQITALRNALVNMGLINLI
jgi:hypothetical protein